LQGTALALAVAFNPFQYVLNVLTKQHWRVPTFPQTAGAWWRQSKGYASQKKRGMHNQAWRACQMLGSPYISFSGNMTQ
jgi:hypothetical protein